MEIIRHGVRLTWFLLPTRFLPFRSAAKCAVTNANVESKYLDSNKAIGVPLAKTVQ